MGYRRIAPFSKNRCALFREFWNGAKSLKTRAFSGRDLGGKIFQVGRASSPFVEISFTPDAQVAGSVFTG